MLYLPFKRFKKNHSLLFDCWSSDLIFQADVVFSSFQQETALRWWWFVQLNLSLAYNYNNQLNLSLAYNYNNRSIWA